MRDFPRVLKRVSALVMAMLMLTNCILSATDIKAETVAEKSAITMIEKAQPESDIPAAADEEPEPEEEAADELEESLEQEIQMVTEDQAVSSGRANTKAADYPIVFPNPTGFHAVISIDGVNMDDNYYLMTVNGGLSYCMDRYGWAWNTQTVEVSDKTLDQVFDANTAKRLILANYYGFRQNFFGIADEEIRYYVTQIYIWNTIHSETFSVSQVKGQAINFASYQAQLDALINKHLLVPSFNTTSIEVHPGETKTITDTNGVLSNYRITKTPANTTASISGNNFVVTGTGTSTASGKIELERSISATGNTIYFENLGPQPSGEYPQNVAILDGPLTLKADLTVKTKQPVVSTTALDKLSETHFAHALESVTLVDKVKCTDLIVGNSYTIKGVLMDAETGDPLLVEGNQVTAQRTVTASAETETFELTFGPFNASELEGKKTVVFEELYYQNRILAVHKEITDENQTVEFPEVDITTAAKDKDSGTNVGAERETVTIVDTVNYIGLIPGEEYTVEGILYDKDTGKPFRDENGKKVEASKTFTADKRNGSVDLEFTFSKSALQGKAVVVFEELYYYDVELATHTNINDKNQTVEFEKITLGTSAADSETGGSKAVASEEVKLVDTVSYTGLDVTKTYVIKGVLMDKATGQPLEAGGQQVIVEQEFQPNRVNGTVDVTFTFDASEFKGKDFAVVVFEKLYVKGAEDDGEEVTVHEDLKDKGQTVEFPGIEIETNAKDEDSDSQETGAFGEVTIIDEVSYKGLIPGQEYTIKGVLMDKSTNAPLLVNGDPVVAKKTFVPSHSEGTAELKFTFDSSALKGTTVVVFERLYYNEKEVAVHTDIDDKDQTVEIPGIGTVAKDSETDDNIAKADGTVTIVDTVYYKGLLPGKVYTLSGVLMDKETGKPLLVDGKKVTSWKTFTPAAQVGYTELRFNFDASALKGATVVVFETVSHNNREIAVHADINDEGQTIHFPGIETNASDLEDGDEMIPADEEVTIVDVVTYKNLIAGKEYTVRGTLMDKATGEPLLIDGQEITAVESFTAEEPDGEIELTFTFNSRALQGSTIVVFEKLIYNEKEVAVHEDIEDEDQSVDVPDIKTNASDSETGVHEGISGDLVTIIDEVSYKNLVIGKDYTIKGILMNKETGEPLLSGGEEITAEVTFTAEERNGTIEMEFTFDASLLNNDAVVVFEKLYEGEIEIAVHEDLEDEDQTVEYKNKVSILKIDKETGEPLAGAVLVIKDPSDDNKVLEQWTSTGEAHDITGLLEPENTYILSELRAPEGYHVASDQEFAGTDQEVVMEDPRIQPEDQGEVRVTKITSKDGELFASTLTFYTALFSDQECTNRVSEVKALEMNGAHSTTVSFTNLAYGTYYVAETDEYGEMVEGSDFHTVDITNGEVTVTEEIKVAKALIDNQYPDYPDGYRNNYGDIEVTKRVVSAATGKEKAVDATFYVGLFLDEECEYLIGQPQPLQLKGASSTTITYKGLAAGTYYIAETDKNGVPLADGADGFDYNISIDHAVIDIEQANTTYPVTITNTYTGSEPETPKTTSSTGQTGSSAAVKSVARAGSVKTQDNSTAMYWLILMSAEAGAVVLIYRKRRQTLGGK